MDKLIKVGAGAWGDNWKTPYQVVDFHSHTKTAQAAWHPRISRYLNEHKFGKNEIVLVVTPLGVFEAWGPNTNGDAFEQRWIEPEHEDWGHKSFEVHANAFIHHQNKDPEKSFGKIPVAVYEPTMRRVELIFVLNRERATAVGSEYVVRDLDAGKRLDLSMGCKVPYDVCSICENRAKNPSEYCKHIKDEVSQILPDGRVVCMYNHYPRFFDLSFVVVRAAKEAAILQKIASASGRNSDIDWSLAVPISGVEKVASSKVADEKLAELIKRFPDIYNKVVEPVYRSEEPLSDDLLDVLSKFRLPSALSSSAALGVILRPREFQRVYLNRTGRPDMSDDFHRRGVVFRSSSCRGSGRYNLFPDDIISSLCSRMMDLLPSRSILQPHITKRILIVHTSGPKVKERTLIEKSGGVLDEVGAEYAKYINGLSALPTFLKSAMVTSGDVYDSFAVQSFDSLFGAERMKLSSANLNLKTILAVAIPLYLLAAKLRKDRDEGEGVGMLGQFVSNYPGTTAAGALTGLSLIRGHRL